MRKSHVAGVGLLLLLLYMISNTVWFHCGASLYGRDVAGHLLLVEKFYYRIHDPIERSCSPVKIGKNILSLFHEDALSFHHTYIWPKLVHITASLVCCVVGLRTLVIIHCNLVFFGILLISTYLIGMRCASPPTGILAALLVSLYPAIFGQSRKFGLDFPLTAMTALNICMLLRTGYFRERRGSLLLGLTMGLGLLTKGQIVIYMAVPIVYSLLKGIRSGGGTGKIRMWNFILCFLVASGVSAIWWWGIVRPLWRAYFITVTDYPFSWAYEYQRQQPFTVRWLLFHAVHCAISVSPFFFMVFIISLAPFFCGKARNKNILLLWILSAYAIWTASNIKRDTDFLPCLPAIALISAIGIMSLQRAALRRLAVACCCIFGLTQYFCVSFSPAGYRFWTMENPYHKPCEPDEYSTLFQPPFPNNYREIINAFADRMQMRGEWEKYSRLGFVETTGSERWLEYNPAILEYYLRLKESGGIIYRSRYNPEAFLERARSFRYLIVMDRRNGSSADWNELRGFFSDARWTEFITRAFGSREELLGIFESYARYPVLAHNTMLPDRCGIFLCEKGPIRVTPGGEIPASAYALSNLITTPPVIGAGAVPRHSPLIPEYDTFFPFWLRFPLVDSDIRYPGDPYFCEYELEFGSGGYVLWINYAWEKGGVVSVSLDGISADVTLESAGGPGSGHMLWKRVWGGVVSSGQHRVRLEGRDSFPLLAAIRFDKL
ncbi:MAG: glycosyltransferase family 39 protein [Candidatus Aureabacteria bacterium]|nr:glycosyltransferase family 39 protein [Candidatus Auribacterota bacterium]